jgi:hypothetical protein
MNELPDFSHPLSPLEYYRLIRDRIEHEDNLIMQRLSWLLASQSFLFTAYAIALSGLSSAPSTATNALMGQERLLFQLIPVVGILACGLIYLSIIAAVKAIRLLRESYRSRFGPEETSLPDIMVGSPIRRLGLAAPLWLPPVFIPVWLILWMRGMV